MKAILSLIFCFLFVRYSKADSKDFTHNPFITESDYDRNFEEYKNKDVDDLNFLCASPVYRLEKLPMRTLRIFRIKNCGIAEIADDAFDNVAGSLEELDLSGNTLTKVPDFSNLPKLKKLVLNENQISMLQPNERNMDWLSVEHLEISNNGIVELTKSSLSQFKNLKVLDISYNPNIKISPDAFSSLKLESLTMNVNGIKTLPVEAINSIPSLTTLSLDNNQMTELPPNAFASLSNLTSLSLKSNSLTTLPIGVFNGLKSLRKLILNYNGISHLPTDVFSGLDELEGLDLSHNKLTKLQTGLFSKLDILLNLMLAENQIDEIFQNALPPLEKGAQINLRTNKLTSLNISSFAPLEKSSELRKYNCEDDFKILLKDNPLNCNNNNNLTWLVASYKNPSGPRTMNNPFALLAMLAGGLQNPASLMSEFTAQPIDDPRCATPRRYAKMPLSELKFKNNCETESQFPFNSRNMMYPSHFGVGNIDGRPMHVRQGRPMWWPKSAKPESQFSVDDDGYVVDPDNFRGANAPGFPGQEMVRRALRQPESQLS